jgi:tetratricopeptide (TPR) repeat protein
MTERHDKREANACFILGVLLEDAGEPQCAATLFHKAISQSPDSAKPHVRLASIRWMEGDTAGMYEAYRTAVRLDPQAVRDGVQEEPEEARLISLVLYPRQYNMSLPPVDMERVVPFEVRDRVKRQTRAERLVAEGRNAEAIEELEQLLTEDPEEMSPVPLLVLAYLLLQAAGGAGGTADNRKSTLWKIDAKLAKLLFQS